MTSGYQGPNRLLASLDAADYARLANHLEPMELALLDPLEAGGEPVEHVYFPTTAIASMVAKLRRGTQSEVGLIGPEGMVGTALLVEAPSAFDCYVQFPGSALRLAATVLRQALGQSPPLLASLSLYTHTLSIQTAYTVLSGAHASVEDRLARWLLMINDRITGRDFDVTHQLLATMLGVRRSGVTEALHVLEGERLIRSTRGHVMVLNRNGLMVRAGNAYGKTETSYDDLIEAAGRNRADAARH